MGIFVQVLWLRRPMWLDETEPKNSDRDLEMSLLSQNIVTPSSGSMLAQMRAWSLDRLRPSLYI